MKFTAIAALYASLALKVMQVHAQGCSDAGFCTAGALQHNKTSDSSGQSSIGVSLTVGSGEQGTAITVPQIEWKQSLPHSLQLELKASWYFASGNLGSASGIGDPILTISKSWRASEQWRGFATAGIRASLTNADDKDGKGRPLPMPYQHGLGTTDAIVGVGGLYRTWLFLSAGYQQPLIHYNENSYLADAYPLESDAYRSYFSSRKLRRQGDVLLRAEGMAMRSRWTLSGGPLLIYHLGNDKITTRTDEALEVVNSSGVTLNLAGRISYTKGKSRFELGGGAPAIVRKQRPDGLTRHWVVTLRYEWALQ